MEAEDADMHDKPQSCSQTDNTKCIEDLVPAA
jgi:hypothetical protein